MSYQRYKSRRSTGRSKYIWLGSALLLLAIAAGGILWALSGNKGAITPMAAPSKVVHGPASLDFISPYIYFSYSSTYQAVRQPPAGTSLQMAMLSADTSYQKHLAVAVFPLDAGGLDGFSPYAVRKVQPALYKRADVPVKGGTAIVFSKADNSEITAIIPHADKLATLSFTTASSYDDLSTEVNALLKSFYWKP